MIKAGFRRISYLNLTAPKARTPTTCFTRNSWLSSTWKPNTRGRYTECPVTRQAQCIKP